MHNIIKDYLKGSVVIVAIGNVLKGDDGVGPYILEHLEGSVGAVCINAGVSLESYSGKILKEKPDTIIFIDALHLEKKPGEYEILDVSDIQKSGFTTHDLSCRMFFDFLRQHTSASMYMLGIQPKTLALGDCLSGEVEASAKKIVSLIKEAFNARDTSGKADN